MTSPITERKYKFTTRCWRCNWSEHVFEVFSCLTRQCYVCPNCGNDHLKNNVHERKHPSSSLTEAVSDSEAEAESGEAK